jgi:flagellar basal-body rod modification protein FlgD
MAAAAGIFSHHLAAGQALTGSSAAPTANAASGTSSSGSADGSSDASSDSSTISANDFLTLLVTEMQNQDPTADTDPNEYINQLVQVNSLEQLIDINQNLSTALGGSSTGSGASPSGQVVGASASANPKNPTAAQHKGTAVSAVQNAGSSLAASGTAEIPNSAAKRAPGNLSVPDAQPAAQRVAHALNGRSHPHSIAGSLPEAQ